MPERNPHHIGPVARRELDKISFRSTMRREARQEVNEALVLLKLANEKLSNAQQTLPIGDDSVAERLETIIGQVSMARHLGSHLHLITG
jgi:hypothetical protein